MKSPSPTDPIEQRLIKAAGDAAGLRATLDALRRRRIAAPHDVPPLGRLAAMLSACAKEKPGTAEFEFEVARELFLRRFGHVSLPPPLISPQTSLVLRAWKDPALAGTVAALAALLAGQAIELVVADTGLDPQAWLLTSHVPNLVVIHADSEAASVNLAVSITRAPVLVLLEGAPGDITSWPDLGTAWIGAAGSRCLAQLGIRLPPGPKFEPLVSLAVARSRWCSADGLDQGLEDGDGLELADLALKLDRAGTRLMSCASFDQAASPPDPPRHWDRMARFRARWGGEGASV